MGRVSPKLIGQSKNAPTLLPPLNYDRSLNYVAPAGYEGGRHKIPAKGRKSGKSNESARSPLFAAIFPEVVGLADKLWDIFCIYLRDNFSYSSFKQQHLIPVLTMPWIADLSLG